MSYQRFAKTLAGAFGLLWIALAIAPRNRLDWSLENVLVLLSVPIFVSAYRHRLFSRAALVYLFAFMCLHEIGAHYSYSHVPYDEWWRALTGRSFDEMIGWERNQFDRVIHFLYGLLLACPMREIFLRIANARGFWG